MLVRLGWPDCYYADGEPAEAPQDAFWVECSPDEGLPLVAERTDEPQVPVGDARLGSNDPIPDEPAGLLLSDRA